MARPREFDTETVLDAAMNLFWKQGYDGTGLTELLDAMRIQRGSLYKAWGSKKRLFMAVLDRYDALHIAPGLSLLEGEGKAAAMNGQDRISAVFEAHDDRGCLMCNSAGGVAGTDPDIAAWIDERIARLDTAFETALADTETGSSSERRVQARNLARRYMGMRIGQRVKGAGTPPENEAA